MTFRKSLDILDLLDEMVWEDSEKISLEEAGLEESNPNDAAFLSGIHAYLSWFYDGEQSEFDK